MNLKNTAQMKPGTEEDILHDPIHIKFKSRQNETSEFRDIHLGGKTIKKAEDFQKSQGRGYLYQRAWRSAGGSGKMCYFLTKVMCVHRCLFNDLLQYTFSLWTFFYFKYKDSPPPKKNNHPNQNRTYFCIKLYKSSKLSFNLAIPEATIPSLSFPLVLSSSQN